MVLAFAGLSTITSFLPGMAGHVSDALGYRGRGALAQPVYILVAALSWPVLYGLFRCARGRENLPEAVRAAAEATTRTSILAAGLAAVPGRYLRFMGRSELFWTPFKQFATAAGRFPVRRGERDTAAIETAAALP